MAQVSRPVILERLTRSLKTTDAEEPHDMYARSPNMAVTMLQSAQISF